MTELFENGFDDDFTNDFFHHDTSHDYVTDSGHHSLQDNDLGGHDFVENGIHQGHSEENVMHGKDYFDENNHLVARTMDNGIGGQAVYTEHGFEGTLTHDGIEHHATFVSDDGHFTHIDSAYEGNAGHIMSYDDPLAHIDQYILPDLLL